MYFTCTFCISIKMEMETAHRTIKEVGVEFLNWVGSMWLRKSSGASGSPCPVHLTPFLIWFTWEWVRGQLSGYETVFQA